jgi:protein MAK11
MTSFTSGQQFAHIAVAVGTYEHVLQTFAAVADEESSSGGGVTLVLTAAYTPHMAAITCLSASAGTGTLVSGSVDETVRVYDLRRRVEAGRLDQHSGTVSAVALDASGAYMLSAGDGANDASLCIWRTRDWEPLRTIPNAHLRGVTALALHPSGRIALSLGRDSMLKMWNLTTAKLACSSKEEADATAVVWDRAGSFFVLACGSKVVVVQTAAGSARKSLETPSPVVCIEALSAGFIAAGCVNGKTYVWDAAAERRVAVLEDSSHTARIKAMAYVPDASCIGLAEGHGMLVTASTDGLLALWNEADWSLLVSHDTKSRITCVAAISIIGNIPKDHEVKEEEPTTVSSSKEEPAAEPAAPKKKKQKKEGKTKVAKGDGGSDAAKKPLKSILKQK